MRCLKLVLSAVLLLTLLGGIASGATASLRIGVVDVDYLLNNHPKAEEVRAQLKSFIRKQEAQVKKQIDKLRKTVKDKNKLRQREAEVYRKAQGEFDKYKRKLLSTLLKDVNLAIREAAKKRGITIVFIKRAVFFGGIDITQDAFAILKKKYGKVK